MSNIELKPFSLRLMGRQLMLHTKVEPKSTNWYENAIHKKNYMMLKETSLNVIIVMHFSLTRSNWIVIKLSKTNPLKNKT